MRNASKNKHAALVDALTRRPARRLPQTTLEENQNMPGAWSNKDERQYEHIKDSQLERQESPERAEEIAARTVNKRRRQEGRTPNRTTQGTGNPNRPLEDRTVDELRNMAAEMHIKGRSKMKKAELVHAVRDHR